MSNQAEIDYEKQFQEDLAKATALSLESQALDDFRRSKSHYPYLERNSASPPNAGNNKKPNELYYAAQSRFRPGSYGVPNSTSIAPPPAVPSRRHSEIRLPEDTPAPAVVAESDLISFASPTSLKKPENTTFDKLLEDIQKLSTTPPPPLPPINSHPNFGSTPAFLNQQLNHAGMQLVPFTPQQPAQKTPLTNEELSKLYSMPAQQVRHPHGIGFVRPAGHYAPAYPHPRPAITAAGYGFGVAGPPVNYGFQYGMQRPTSITTQQSYPPAPMPNSNYQHQQPPTTDIPIQSVSNPSSALVLQNPTNPLLQMTKSQSLSGVTSLGTSPSIRSNSSNGINRKAKRNLGDDLIDLTQDDPSRVSVLEAFDPLLNEDDYVLWK